MSTHHPLLAALLVAASLHAPPASAQQHIDLSLGPVDYTTWTLFGTAQAQNFTPGNGYTYSVLDLTQIDIGDQAGAAFAPGGIELDFNQAFSFHFNWYIPVTGNPGLRGDGMSFVLADAPALGNGGSGLGYEGLSPASVAWAIDTFNFDDEAESPSLQILAGGQITPLVATETALGDSIRDPDFQWFGSLVYTPSGNDDQTGMLRAQMDHINLGSFSAEVQVDFAALGLAGGSPVYYGFTASNGAATDGHSTSWAAPIPEPQSWALMLAGLTAMGWLGRRRKSNL